MGLKKGFDGFWVGGVKHGFWVVGRLVLARFWAGIYGSAKVWYQTLKKQNFSRSKNWFRDC